MNHLGSHGAKDHEADETKGRLRVFPPSEGPSFTQHKVRYCGAYRAMPYWTFSPWSQRGYFILDFRLLGKVADS